MHCCLTVARSTAHANVNTKLLFLTESLQQHALARPHRPEDELRHGEVRQPTVEAAHFMFSVRNVHIILHEYPSLINVNTEAERERERERER